MRWSVVLMLLFTAGCAQVGTLTGGDRDTTAPKPIAEKSVPQNKTLNFSGNEIRLSFDEYVSLSKPNENLIVVPPNIKPQVTAKGKTVIISWEDTLLPNTTYAFYMNGLIRDVTEGNDSLITYVFSTGPQLDSLQQTVVVTDAETGKPLNRMTVGLYSSFADTLKPTYFAETNEQGKATIRYMKPGVFELVVFKDNNKNLLLDPNEVVGFSDESIRIETGKSDTIGIKAFTPEKPKRISTFQFIPPGAFIVGSTSSLTNTTLQLNGELVDSSSWHWFAEDSVSFPMLMNDTNAFELTAAGNMVDTNRLRLRKQTVAATWKPKMLTDEKLKPGQSPRFWTPGRMTLNDTNATVLMLKGDSTALDFEFVQADDLTFDLITSNAKPGKYTFQMFPGAIKVAGEENQDTMTFEWTQLSAEEQGTIIVSCSGFEAGAVLELLSKGTKVESRSVSSAGPIVFKQMSPGSYTFRIVLDENGNGQWDTGSLEEKRQPETIIMFEKSYSLRANWDLEVELQSTNEPETEAQ